MRFLSHGSKARPSLRRGFVPTEESCLDRDESDSDVACLMRGTGKARAAGRAAGGLAGRAKGQSCSF